MATYSIRDLEKISGIKAHTLRMWEQRYSILTPSRTDTNIRFYDDENLRLLLSISMLNSNGLKISKIAKMNSGEIHDACSELCEDCEEFSNQISALTLSMMELDEARFEKIINVSTARHGFEDVMVKIVYPFFERVGILWQTGTICPAQEHFITNLIRQKLVVAIDNLPHPTGENAPKYMLFLPENEMHENPLLFANYLVKARGNRVIYLGANVPESDLSNVYDSYQPDYLLTILMIQPGKEPTGDYIRRLANRFEKSTIIATGQAIFEAKNLPKNTKVLSSVADLLKIAEHVA